MRLVSPSNRHSTTVSVSSTDLKLLHAYYGIMVNGNSQQDLIQPVILSGGNGTRLWPRSRADLPKPFLPLIGERTLFQRALDRVSNSSVFAKPMVVAGAAHAEHVDAQAADHKMIVEPCGKNTAPAIALAASMVPPGTILLVCPSDHYIADVPAFLAGVKKAAVLAREGLLVSFGVEPTRPETGYGYIQRGEAVGAGNRVARFVEKPDAVTAGEFIADGGFVWNAGIFIFRAGALLDELRRHRPEMAAQIAASVKAGREEAGQFYPDAESFDAITGESIDYAVMEHTTQAAVVAADMGWSDIGDWNALMAARRGSADGNVVSGKADLAGCSGVMVDSDGPRVSVVGLDDVIVVVDKGEVLVISRDAAQMVGKLPGAIEQ